EIYALTARQHTTPKAPQGIDLLWKSPWGLRPPPIPAASGAGSQAVWLDHYGGGWQELLPNAGGACTVNGAAHTFHGEASVVPWACEMDVPRGGVPRLRLAVRLARTPLRIEKRIWLDADRPVLHLWERVTNEGAAPQPLMWGHHPAFGAPFLAGGCRLDMPATTFLANTPQVSPASPIAAGARSAWPHVQRADRGGTLDLSVVPGPEARTDRFGYLLNLGAGWYALSNDVLRLGFALTWPLDVFPCVWLWQELCGTQAYPWYGEAYVMGVEPHSSPTAGGLADAIERGTQRTLQPGESLEASLSARLFTPSGRVTRVTPEGGVECA
ncbi:MAG TPA: DUF4432 family protein, partial [Chloroflexota bacterium]|nr:DUF4432 family protein [Chloroflexota bacterium]